MLEHLLDFSPEVQPALNAARAKPVHAHTAQEIINAQYQTALWLDKQSPGSSETDAPLSPAQAQETFELLVGGANTGKGTNTAEAILNLKTPMAVRQLVGMLTAYDWEFVEEAKKLRGYAVAKILDETNHPDSRIRLRALELLGRVTEVALFTDRVEVKKTEMSTADLDQKIKEKLRLFMGVTDVTAKKGTNDGNEELDQGGDKASGWAAQEPGSSAGRTDPGEQDRGSGEEKWDGGQAGATGTDLERLKKRHLEKVRKQWEDEG
jgi:hypothetical protein